jgi:hypothetical protein
VVLVRGVYGELADVRLDASERGRFAHGMVVLGCFVTFFILF